MKTKIFFLTMVVICAFLFVHASYAAEREVKRMKNYAPLESKELVGIWINASYKCGEWKWQKVNITHYGYVEQYCQADSDDPDEKCTYFVVEKWTDSEGNIWYKSIWRANTGRLPYYELDKISKDRATWEGIAKVGDWPSKSDINPEYQGYFIFYRQ